MGRKCLWGVAGTMMKSLSIQNFKSIGKLELNCKRVNLFIGEPNTGKSNILESIGLLSHIGHGDIKRFVRFEHMGDLFYDHILENNITISFDEKALEITFKDGMFTGNYLAEKEQRTPLFSYDYPGSGWRASDHEDFSKFKFYRFAVRERFPNRMSEFLHPPDGDNLLAVILARKELRTIVKQIFDHFGLRLVLEPQENRIKVEKQLEDILISFSYSLASETLQGVIFYLTAIHSNQQSTLAFEEPEAHAFPYYTKYLAERIALDKNENQYFISTHNPVFLSSILEKTPKDELAVSIAYLENFQTKVKPLSEDEIQEILEVGTDVFFNIEKFLG